VIDNPMNNDAYWRQYEQQVSEEHVCWCGKRKQVDREMCHACELEGEKGD